MELSFFCVRILGILAFALTYFLEYNDFVYIVLMIIQANQKDLESATEQLSEYLERDISAENLADIKQKVQDKYRYSIHHYCTICNSFSFWDNVNDIFIQLEVKNNSYYTEKWVCITVPSTGWLSFNNNDNNLQST